MSRGGRQGLSRVARRWDRGPGALHRGGVGARRGGQGAARVSGRASRHTGDGRGLRRSGSRRPATASRGGHAEDGSVGGTGPGGPLEPSHPVGTPRRGPCRPLSPPPPPSALKQHSIIGGPSSRKRSVSLHVVNTPVHRARVAAWHSTSGTGTPATARVFTSVDPVSLWWKGDSSKFSISGSCPVSSRHAAHTLKTFSQPRSRRSSSTGSGHLNFLFARRMLSPCSLRQAPHQRALKSTAAGSLPRRSCSVTYALVSSKALVRSMCCAILASFFGSSQ